MQRYDLAVLAAPELKRAGADDGGLRTATNRRVGVQKRKGLGTELEIGTPADRTGARKSHNDKETRWKEKRPLKSSVMRAENVVISAMWTG